MALSSGRHFIAGVLFLVAAMPAAAQGSRPKNVAFGFAAVTDPHAGGLSSGWSASGALRFRRTTSGVFETSGSYSSLGPDANLRVHSILVGARIAQEREDRFIPFAQFLIGGECYCGTTATLGNLFRGFSMQPGAGVDWRLSPTFALRLQMDVRHTMHESDGVTRFRIGAGAVVRFGPSATSNNAADPGRSRT